MENVDIPKEVVLSNKVEGPQQKVDVNINKDNYLRECPKTKPYDERFDWIYHQIYRELPEGGIKKAFLAAIVERNARKSLDYSFNREKCITKDAEQYAFRGAQRKSNGEDLPGIPGSSINDVDNSLHNFGLENPDMHSAQFIKPGMPAEIWTFPSAEEIQNGTDVSVILVYRNLDFVIPSSKDPTKLVLRNNENGHEKPINPEEAKEHPSLRDNYLGQIRVYYK